MPREAKCSGYSVSRITVSRLRRGAAYLGLWAAVNVKVWRPRMLDAWLGLCPHLIPEGPQAPLLLER